jgi:hypothetical protein
MRAGNLRPPERSRNAGGAWRKPHDAHPAFHPLHSCWNADRGELGLRSLIERLCLREGRSLTGVSYDVIAP